MATNGAAPPNQAGDELGRDRLHSIVTATTQGPREALDQIEKQIAGLRDLINQREAILTAAIEEHTKLAAGATQGADKMKGEVDQIMRAFLGAMRPTPEGPPKLELELLPNPSLPSIPPLQLPEVREGVSIEAEIRRLREFGRPKQGGPLGA